MTPDARIAATIELLTEIGDTDRPAEAAVQAFFRSRRYVGSKDRADIAERIYRLLRHHARLGWWLERVGVEDGPRSRVAAELVLGEGLTAVEAAGRFEGGRYAPAPLTGDERRLVAALDGQPLDHVEMAVKVLHECPDWAADQFGAFGPDDFGWELRALLQPAPFDLRVNEVKADRDSILDALRRDGIAVEPTPYSPIGLRVSGRPPLAGHRLYRAGVIEVQDEGSQLVALLTDARPGQQVVDFCAGAGGKALALGACMQGKGRVVASDVHAGRLSRAKERLHRSGLDNIETRLLRSERDPWISRQKGKFDRVLVDVPCSGSGTWRRHPDARWRPVDLPALTELQGRILAGAARLVRPGGRLVYSTCTLLAAENQDVVGAFLADHPEFESESVTEIWRQVLGGECPAYGAPRPDLLLTPARHGTDGFYVAALRRRSDAG